MPPRTLKKIEEYILWFEDEGSVRINEWLDISTGYLFFCHADVVHYEGIKKEFQDIRIGAVDTTVTGRTIEEVTQNIERDIEIFKDMEKRRIESTTEAKKLMRKYIWKDLEIGSSGDLQLRVMGSDLKKLCITTKVESNLGWEHVFNSGRKVVWHHNSDNIWEALSKKESGKGAQSLMYIEDDIGRITLERDS